MNAGELDKSTVCIKKMPVVSSIEEKLSPARHVLLNRIFMGHYKDRRYVVPLNDYRDVVTISSAESELTRDLDAVNKDLQGIYGIKWVGIGVSKAESSKSGYTFWVKLKDMPFGSFWFQIKEMKHENEEVILRLKCLRSVRPQDYESALEEMTQNSGDAKNSEDLDVIPKIKFSYVVLQDLFQQIRTHLTWNNFVTVWKFITVTIFVFITTLFTYIGHIGDYSLKFLNATTLLLRALTPYYVHAIDCITKVIGGIFLLISLLFRGHGPPQQFHNQYQHENRLVLYPRQGLNSYEYGSDLSANRSIIMRRNQREGNQNF